MVLRDVAHHRDVRVEGGNRLQLEGGDLRHRDVLLAAPQRAGRKRVADVADHVGGLAQVAEDFPDEGGGGGLAVCARHRVERRAGDLRAQLQLADERDARGLHRAQDRRLHGDAGARHGEVVGLQVRGLGLVPQAAADVHALQGLERLCELFLRLAVGDGHARAQLVEALRRAHAGARHAAHQDLFSFKIHVYSPPVLCFFRLRASWRAVPRRRLRS